MQSPPLFSTFTLFTEIIVTFSILYIFYSGYVRNKFPTKLVFLTLVYEILFNISYMTYRALTHDAETGEHAHTAFHTAVAAFHGIFALSMFIALLIFLIIAWRKYKHEINFFKEHRIFTWIFIILWFIAIGSGILFYYLAYFTNT